MFRFFLLCIVFALFMPVHAQPAPITVTVNTDFDTIDVNPGDRKCTDSNNKCSLRAAIMEANALGPGSVIRVPAGTYTLTIPGINEGNSLTGDLDVNQSMTIIGAGARRTIIDGSFYDRVFHLSDEKQVALRNMTVKNGYVNGQNGGGLYAHTGNISLSGMLFTGNQAANGGGIAFNAVSLVYIQNSTFMDNNATSNGGGIAFLESNLVTNNIYTTLRNVTISGNDADAKGGGIHTAGGYHMVSTIGVTISDNNAGVEGGGIDLYFGISSKRTLISDNTAPAHPDCSGYLSFGSQYNLLSSSSGCTVPGDTLIVPGNTLYAPILPGYIGETPIVDLSFSSPAINAGGICNEPDQTGHLRLAGEFCDIGAYEYRDLQYQVLNFDFESGSTGTPPVPNGWKPVNLKNDRLVCNTEAAVPGTLDKIVAFTGNCAMRFTGAPGKNAKLVQPLTALGALANENTTLYLYFYGMGKQVQAGKGHVTVTIKYVDGTSQQIRVKAAAGTYDHRLFTAAVPLRGFVKQASVVIAYQGSAGTFTVDQVLVLTSRIPPMRDAWVPLPQPN